MAIPEAQLETWSHQGSIQQSSQTYNGIRGVLEDPGTPFADKGFKIFLQGSYGNDTNIWSESDVDIVIRLDDCHQSDLSKLTDLKKAEYDAAFANATYTHVNLKSDVLAILQDKYGDDVTPGDKAIAIAAHGNRRKADVIVSIEFRRYWDFNGVHQQRYTSGICFWNSRGTRIVNYPLLHSANLTKKHQATKSRLKPVIRAFKNLRSRCITDKLLAAGKAPSYYLEGLLYNVPTENLKSNLQESFVASLNWIQTQADKDKLVCANEQYYLLFDGTHTSWPKADAEAFLGAAIELWKQW